MERTEKQTDTVQHLMWPPREGSKIKAKWNCLIPLLYKRWTVCLTSWWISYNANHQRVHLQKLQQYK